MAAIIFLLHHRSRAGEMSPRTLKLAASWYKTNPHNSHLICSVKRQSWLCSMSPERPTAGTETEKERFPRTICSGFILFLIYGIRRCFHVISLVSGWLTPITKESNSLIICWVPLWRRPHCLSAQFLSSTKMIASFGFGWFTQENLQMWFFQSRRNGQKWKVSSRLMRHWWQARNIQNKLIL